MYIRFLEGSSKPSQHELAVVGVKEAGQRDGGGGGGMGLHGRWDAKSYICDNDF